MHCEIRCGSHHQKLNQSPCLFFTPHIGHDLAHAQACVTESFEPTHLTTKSLGMNNKTTKRCALFWGYIYLVVHQDGDHKYFYSMLDNYGCSKKHHLQPEIQAYQACKRTTVNKSCHHIVTLETYNDFALERNNLLIT